MGATKWSDELTNFAKGLWLAGRSAAEVSVAIGREFGVTMSRNSCIGRMHRIGAAGPKASVRREASAPRTNKAYGGETPGRKPYTPRPKKEPRPKQEKLVKSVAEKPAYIRPSEPLSANPKTLLQIGPCQCRWPVGPEPRDMADQLFCADPAEERWCPGHKAKGSVVPPTTGNQLARSIRRYVS